MDAEWRAAKTEEKSAELELTRLKKNSGGYTSSSEEIAFENTLSSLIVEHSLKDTIKSYKDNANFEVERIATDYSVD